MGRGALAKHPQTYAMQVDGGVVIARDFSAVPPAGLDAFRFTDETQRTAAPGQPVPHAQRLRRGQEPQGTADGGRYLRAAAGVHAAAAGGGRWLGKRPGVFGPVCRKPCETMYRPGTQACAQTLDESTGLIAGAAAVLAGLPQSVAARQIRHQGVGAQLAGARRFRQVERVQALAEKPGETVHIGCRSRESHHATRRRDMAVRQPALELHDAALACSQEGAEIGEQRGERGKQQGMIFQLAIELTATAEALGGVESNARYRHASGEHIEHGELLTAYAARDRKST